MGLGRSFEWAMVGCLGTFGLCVGQIQVMDFALLAY